VTDPNARVNLASRRLGASVTAASDEFFGEKENLLRPEPPGHSPRTFGHKGQLVDGWETRRRRGPGHDYALIRLGAPGVISQVVVDTAHFTGNFPAACSVEACAAEGYPAPADLLGPSVAWAELVPRSTLAGDSENRFALADARRFTHVRLTIYPDGGVQARWARPPRFAAAARSRGAGKRRRGGSGE
jgi:allantoicase